MPQPPRRGVHVAYETTRDVVGLGHSWYTRPLRWQSPVCDGPPLQRVVAPRRHRQNAEGLWHRLSRQLLRVDAPGEIHAPVARSG
jgi:hypothetical protein